MHQIRRCSHTGSTFLTIIRLSIFAVFIYRTISSITSHILLLATLRILLNFPTGFHHASQTPSLRFRLPLQLLIQLLRLLQPFPHTLLRTPEQSIYNSYPSPPAPPRTFRARNFRFPSHQCSICRLGFRPIISHLFLVFFQ